MVPSRMMKEHAVTRVLELAFKEPQALDQRRARRDTLDRATLDLCWAVLQDSASREDLAMIDRLIRSARECAGSKFVAAQLILEPAHPSESEALREVRRLWRQIVNRTPELQVFGQVALAA